jgi:long-chain fatty acid transport protein
MQKLSAGTPLYSLTILCFFSVCSFAGGFDSSGQPFSILFGEKNAVRFSMNYIEPTLDINASRNLGDGRELPREDVGDLVAGYKEAMLGSRFIFNENIRCASQLEQPYRYNTRYGDDQLSYYSDENDFATRKLSPFESIYKSVSLSVACAYGIGFQHQSALFTNSKLSLIAGPKYQEMSGVFSSDLTPLSMGAEDNYQANLNGSKEWGYLLGMAYEIPEIAFRVSLFYHSEIHHDLGGNVIAPTSDLSSLVNQAVTAETLTPQSINFYLQSGLSEKWLAFLSMRWGDWSELDEIALEAGPSLSQTIDLFELDTLNYQFGFGYQLSDNLSLGGYFASLLSIGDEDLPEGVDGKDIRNPDNGRFSVGLGGRYMVSENLQLGFGASYFYMSAGKFVDNNYTVELDNSYALAVAGSMTYLY